MKVLALVSGGKDSTYAIIECLRHNHQITCLGNLEPINGIDELDSFMYQTVGHEAIKFISEAMEIPLIRKTIERQCTVGELIYEPKSTDEVEDMLDLLSTAKEQHGIEAVSCGAIASTYQRTRVENVCARLGLVSLSYLWKRDQIELLKEMFDAGIEAILIKIAGIGLTVEKHLGNRLSEITEDLIKFNKSFGINPCGEGGEFETFTVDACCFKKRIIIDETKVVEVDRNHVCPVAHLNVIKAHCRDKLSKNGNGSCCQIKAIDRSYMYHLEELDGLHFQPGEDKVVPMETELLSSDVKQSRLNVPECKSVLRKNNFCFCVISRKILADKIEETLKSFDQLMQDCDEALKTIESSLSNTMCIQLYVPKMSQFAELNKVYHKYFTQCQCPPARSCVEVPTLNSVCLNIVSKWDHSDKKDRRLYVRSISHWAPANIGPYSQYVTFEGTSFISGQIPMVPATLDLVQSNLFSEHAKLALHHAKAIILEAFPKFLLRRQLQEEEGEEYETYGQKDGKWSIYCICYVTSSNYFQCIVQIWEYLKLPRESLLVLEVPHLPKNSCVEWEFSLIDREINEKNNFAFKVFNEADKFLGKIGESVELLKGSSRMFVSEDVLITYKNDDCFNNVVNGNSVVCLVPVVSVYNGSLAICSFSSSAAAAAPALC